MKSREFAEIFTPLCKYYGKDPSDKVLIELYYTSFKPVDVEIFKKAVTRAIRTMKFFPKISELWEIIEGNKEDKKALAWEFVMKHLEHATRMTYEEEAPEGTHETVRRLGGWFQIGTQWSLADVGFLKRDFYDLFTCESEMPLLALAQRQLPQIGDIPNLQDAAHVKKLKKQAYTIKYEKKKL